MLVCVIVLQFERLAVDVNWGDLPDLLLLERSVSVLERVRRVRTVVVVVRVRVVVTLFVTCSP